MIDQASTIRDIRSEVIEIGGQNEAIFAILEEIKELLEKIESNTRPPTP